MVAKFSNSVSALKTAICSSFAKHEVAKLLFNTSNPSLVANIRTNEGMTKDC